MKILDGYLTFKSHGEDIIIEEMPLSAYEVFFRCWVAMVTTMVEGNEDADVETSFFEMLTMNAKFRQNVEVALQTMGIENPFEVLTPRQIRALFLGDAESNVGYLFKLHGTTPKLTPRSMKLVSQQPGSKSSLNSSQSSTGGGQLLPSFLSKLNLWIDSLSRAFYVWRPSVALPV
jgi:hypothetical protein